MTDRHVLTIEPVGEDLYKGYLLLGTGDEHTTHRADRAQVLAWAQKVIEQVASGDPIVPQVETLLLDHAGEIVRDDTPETVRDWSVRV